MQYAPEYLFFWMSRKIAHKIQASRNNNHMKILLRQIMNDKNLSVRQVTILTGVPKSTINGIMNGVIPRLDTMERLAKGLNVHIIDLFESPYK